MKPLRIGSVPYLNAKPLTDWLHTSDCEIPVEVVYVVPSRLAELLEAGDVDVAMVSIFEWFRRPQLGLVPGISISADGPVKSVRLFSKVPVGEIRSLALDTSSLTSVALVRILLAEMGVTSPELLPMPPDLGAMLDRSDAGLLIGDLRLFESPAEHVYDLGAMWKERTGLPFVYAAWLARPEADLQAIGETLTRARDWGCERLEALSARWSVELGLPEERVRDYFINVMRYDLDERKMEAIKLFERKCREHGLIT
jgi:chorismate dehydratase